MTRRFISAGWFFGLFLFLVGAAEAQPNGFTITEIANQSGLHPYPFYAFPAINENGEVCYRGGGETASAILKGDGVFRREIARADVSESTFGHFPSGVCSINNAGDVAFDGCFDCTFEVIDDDDDLEVNSSVLRTNFDEAKVKGIYIGNGLAPAAHVQPTGDLPGDFLIAVFPTLSNSGAVSFTGELNDGTQGIFVRNGITLLNPFNNLSQFESLGAPFLNNNDELSFGATAVGTEVLGVYGPTGNLITSTQDGFDRLGLSVMNDLGNIAYLARRPFAGLNVVPEQGVWVDGSPRVTNASGAFSRVDLSGFQSVSINDLNDVVFPAIRPNGDPVVFLSLEGGLLKLFEKGDTLPGHASPVETARVGRESINSQRHIALVVRLQDETEFVVRLEPDGLNLDKDGCPDDSVKFEPGICGCGIADFDSNADGIFDCEVTRVIVENVTALQGWVKKLKGLKKGASKKKKQAVKEAKAEIKAILASVLVLIETSSDLVKFQTVEGAEQFAKLTKDLRKNVKKSLKTGNAKFKQNKRKATKSVKKFLGVLDAGAPSV